MSVVIDPNMSGLEDASARLAELEASDNGAGEQAAEAQAQREEGAARAGAGTEGETQPPVSTETDTPAAPEQGKAQGQEQSQGKEDPSKADAGKAGDDATRDPKGRYAKAQERLEKTWDSVNKRKGELDTREQQMVQRENALKQRESDLEHQAQQSQAQHKPEDFEKAAGLKIERSKGLHLEADGLDAKAKKAEDDGKYVEAAQLAEQAKAKRKAAYKEEGNAEDLKSHADQLRKNPPPSAKQTEDKLAVQRKEWTTKAATDFPELAKKDSPLQKSVAAHLNALWQSDRVLASHPQIIYHVTRLAAAETAAARVPTLVKELGQLKAKVQEYEKLTAPGGPGAAQRPPSGQAAGSEEDERAELLELANGMGGIR